MASVTRSKTTHRDRRTATARRVLDATDALLRGGERFTEIPVERLLAEADVSRSTFYVHFADKSVLLMQLAEQALADIATAADVWWALNHVDNPEPAAKTIRGMIKVYRRHAHIMRAITEVSTYDDGINSLQRRWIEEYTALSVGRMAQEQEQGLIGADVDIEYVAALIIRLINSSIIDHIAYGSPRNDARLANTLARVGWLSRYGSAPASGAAGQG
ncbi:TetR/AcrR family transcriptional regulator [Nocardia sp. CA-136227]|uniref:TetR/AcrR family transcriptional regulator n=1 Tax=Nocardia sp. CA-136227 TaxID=3239979 RepID=UPI003D988FBD